jgi:hypothetical protein
MANAFSKEERVAFEDILEGFQDFWFCRVTSSVYNTNQTEMARTNDTIWRPMPYIAQSINSTPGTSISSSYQNMTQLSVPSTIGFSKTVPWTMTTLDLARCIARRIVWVSQPSKSSHPTSTWQS